MAERVMVIGTKEILLSKALKYFNDPARCQRKLDLTEKEYKALIKILKNQVLQKPPSQPMQTQIPLQFQPQQHQYQSQQQHQYQSQQQQPQSQQQQQQSQQPPPQQQPQSQQPPPQQQPQSQQPLPRQHQYQSQQPPPQQLQKSWYGAGNVDQSDKALMSNTALLDRRFFNVANEIVASPPQITPRPTVNQTFYQESHGPASRVFDNVMHLPVNPIAANKPTPTRGGFKAANQVNTSV